jgi:hypothetical protein
MFYTWLNRSKYSGRDLRSSGGADEDYILLGYDTVWNGQKLPTLRKSLLPPSSGLQNVKTLTVRDKQTFMLWPG